MLQNPTLQFTLNGVPIFVQNPNPKTLLVDYLRVEKGLVGTKKSCAQAGCGACVVAMTESDGTVLSVNSCIRPIVTLNGKSITTIEGIGSLNTPNSISSRLAEDNGTQCGFCSPGMVMNMYSLLGNPSNPQNSSQLAIQQHFDGNLCRCTGYRSILEAMCSFVPATTGNTPKSSFSSTIPNLVDLHDQKPKRSLPKIIAVSNWPDTFLLRGNTSTGVYSNHCHNFLDVQAVTELNQIVIGAQSVLFGGAVTLSQLILTLTELSTSSSMNSATQNRFVIMLQSVRNVGSLAGNLMMVYDHGFVSDLFIVLAAAGATLTLVTPSVIKKCPNLDQSSQTVSMFNFLSTNMTQTVIAYITIPFAQSGVEVLRTYKVMQRAVNSHAIVNAGFYGIPTNNSFTSAPLIAYGGVGATFLQCPKTALGLVGQNLTSPATLAQALANLVQEAVAVHLPAENTAYRQSLVFTLFYKWQASVLTPFERPLSSGQQSYQSDPNEYPVSAPIEKLEGISFVIEALRQTTGTAPYVDDVPTPPNTLHAAFVKSTHPLAVLSSIDWTEALKMPGVYGKLDATDIPAAQNEVGPVVPDEPLFTPGQIMYRGQSLGLILADTQVHAIEAAARAIINYQSVSSSPLLDFDAAIKAKSFFPPNPALPTGGPINSGDVATGFASSQNILEGEKVSCGHQYHFHMETQTHYAAPGENGTLNILSANQWPAFVQQMVARATNLPQNKITVNVMRCGGGFGGKITRVNYPVVAAAYAAQYFNRPVKIVMSIEDNMELIGKRTPVKCSYKIGFNNDAKIQALQVYFYIDGGATYDGTPGNIGLMLQTVDNCYYLPNFSGDGVAVQTNTPANTAMRGPGWVPATYTMEAIMEHVARQLGMDPWVVKERNFYKNGQVSPAGQKINHFTIEKIWPQLKESSDFENRVQAVKAFNAANRWTKQGIAMVPIKFGIGFGGDTHSALVVLLLTPQINVYADGSVEMSLSGVEIGQGLNTKAAQVCALKLGVDLAYISVTSHSTLTNPNTQATGGSVTTGVVCGAVIAACATLQTRLAPIRKLYPTLNWPQLCSTAITAGVDMEILCPRVFSHQQSVTGWNNPGGGDNGPFNYESYSAVVTQVQLDVLTGTYEILRADILFDCGRSLNPLLDIGQVEGAFVMGLGYFLWEDIIYNTTTGKLLTNSSWSYKPPSALDIPIDLRVALLKNVPNPFDVLGSKAQGEPPLCLASSALFAVEAAVAAARHTAGLAPNFKQIRAPCTVTAAQLAAGITPAQLTF